jgi:hypothetical protein
MKGEQMSESIKGDLTERCGSVPQAPLRRPIYVASRASLPERPAMWRKLRDAHGWNITSTWIDEAGEGETAAFDELWLRIEREIQRSRGLILFAERDDFPLKGALIEVGMAIGMQKPVAVCLGGKPFLEPRSLRPVGSWLHHPRVKLFHTDETLKDAYRWIEGMP